MISRTLALASAIVVTVVLGACSDSTAPPQLASEGLSAAAATRSGTFHVEKECSTFTGHAGDICTITSSTLAEIEPGSTITYASDAVGALLDTDVVLDLPGPGSNRAYGHCTVDLATIVGGCVFSGGTGKFTWFHASVALSYLGGPAFGGANFAWNGTYSFGPRD
jgi:hypothetical protein